MRQDDRGVANDIHLHFTTRCEALPGRGLVVAYSEANCCRARPGVCASASARRPSTASSPPARPTRSRSRCSAAQSHSSFSSRRTSATPTTHFRIVVVKDMWLTGFDAPALHTLYVDKPMRDHGLMQAIARVNRVFRDKRGGLVVDYLGIGEDLRGELRAYDETELEDPAIPIAQGDRRAVGEVRGTLRDALPRRVSQGRAQSRRRPLALDPGLLGLRAGPTSKRIREFLGKQAALAKWYTLIGHPTGRDRPARGDLLLQEARGRGAQDRHAGPPRQAPRPSRPCDSSCPRGSPPARSSRTLALADQVRPDISVLSEEFLDSIAAKTEHPNIQIRLLEKLLKNEVKSRSRTNQAQAKLFAEQLDAVLHRYELRQISSAEVVQRLVEIARSLREAGRRHEQLGLTAEEAAFYDALAGGADAPNVDPQLAKIARDLVKSDREDLTVDWADRASTEAAIRRKMRRLLREHEYQPPTAAPGGGTPKTSTTSPSSCSTRPRLCTGTGQTSRAGCSSKATESQ